MRDNLFRSVAFTALTLSSELKPRITDAVTHLRWRYIPHWSKFGSIVTNSFWPDGSFLPLLGWLRMKAEYESDGDGIPPQGCGRRACHWRRELVWRSREWLSDTVSLRPPAAGNSNSTVALQPTRFRNKAVYLTPITRATLYLWPRERRLPCHLGRTTSVCTWRATSMLC